MVVDGRVSKGGGEDLIYEVWEENEKLRYESILYVKEKKALSMS
jgi:hypothetical protein